MAFVHKIRSDKIVIKGFPIQKEAALAAGQTLYPGQLVALNPDGKTVQAESGDAGANTRIAVATENSMLGKTKEDAYTGTAKDPNKIGGDNVFYCVSARGTEIQFRLEAAAPALTAGDMLQSNGEGGVEKLASGNTPIAICLESVDNSSGLTPTFIVSEIF